LELKIRRIIFNKDFMKPVRYIPTKKLSFSELLKSCKRNGIHFNTTYLNSADVSPGMEIAPKSSFGMIESGHGNTETSPLCLQVYVPYGMDSEIPAQGPGKGSG